MLKIAEKRVGSLKQNESFGRDTRRVVYQVLDQRNRVLASYRRKEDAKDYIEKHK